MTLKGKIAIVGIGEVPTGKYPNRSALEAAIVACREAIIDSGLKKEDIDYIMPTGHLADSRFNTDLIFSRLVDELGMGSHLKGNLQVMSGGASSATMLKSAAGLVSSGQAKAVLCVHSEKLGTGKTSQEVIDLFSTLGIPSEWETPYGMHFSAVAGLITQRFMFETGTTAEQLAAVCVSNRKWAELNPNAMFRKPLSVEDVLNSKMLSTPLHAFESNMLADGAAAFIVTSAERAKQVTDTPVFLLGEGSRVTQYALSQAKDMTRFGYEEAGIEAFEGTGLTPADMDMAQIYDSYPVFSLIGLESLGFCERGTAGKFVLDGHTAPGGKLPLTTNGGMLSQGHTGVGGGVAILVETARQLMGKAGQRQIPNARFALETATGGTYMDIHVSIFGREIV